MEILKHNEIMRLIQVTGRGNKQGNSKQIEWKTMALRVVWTCETLYTHNHVKRVCIVVAGLKATLRHGYYIIN